MEFGAIFSDYDGTLASEGLRREKSKVPEDVRSALVTLSARVPIAIITSKDYGFVEPRTSSFARAWACVSGLDVRLVGEEPDLIEALDVRPKLASLERRLPKGLLVERKEASDGSGRLLGFSLDWTWGTEIEAREITSIIRILKDEGLFATYWKGNTYLDAFARRPDKGAALQALVRRLEVVGPVLYIGDSEADNRAFDRADVAVGVDHGQPTKKLRCDHLLDSRDLASFLRSLLDGRTPKARPRTPGPNSSRPGGLSGWRRRALRAGRAPRPSRPSC